MSVFNKKAIELPADFTIYDDDELFLDDVTPEQFISARQKTARYTIDQASSLVNSLNNNNVSTQVIAGVVRKTLESADIRFDEIIDDAKSKEAALLAEFQRREKIINSLVEKVERLQQQNRLFQQELEKTVYAREFLQRADSSASAEATGTAPKAAGNAVAPASGTGQRPAPKKVARKRKVASVTV